MAQTAQTPAANKRNYSEFTSDNQYDQALRNLSKED